MKKEKKKPQNFLSKIIKKKTNFQNNFCALGHLRLFFDAGNEYAITENIY